MKEKIKGWLWEIANLAECIGPALYWCFVCHERTNEEGGEE